MATAMARADAGEGGQGWTRAQGHGCEGSKGSKGKGTVEGGKGKGKSMGGEGSKGSGAALSARGVVQPVP